MVALVVGYKGGARLWLGDRFLQQLILEALQVFRCLGCLCYHKVTLLAYLHDGSLLVASLGLEFLSTPFAHP